jgi:hypothetical protein
MTTFQSLHTALFFLIISIVYIGCDAKNKMNSNSSDHNYEIGSSKHIEIV